MRACACGERRILPHSMPGIAKSAPYIARPVTFGTPSGRIGRVPTHLNRVGAISFTAPSIRQIDLLCVSVAPRGGKCKTDGGIMALEVRRIVTGHDANGKAVVKTDERLQAVGRLGRPHIAGCEIWSTDNMPVDNTSEESEAAQRAGFVKRYNYVGTGQGSVIRITEFAPGAPKFMHRTETVDYALLLSGECDLELDSGEVAHLTPGDVVVQRGTMHAWVNHGPAPCVFAFILIDAKPAEVAGQELRTHSPAP